MRKLAVGRTFFHASETMYNLILPMCQSACRLFVASCAACPKKIFSPGLISNL